MSEEQVATQETVVEEPVITEQVEGGSPEEESPVETEEQKPAGLDKAGQSNKDRGWSLYESEKERADRLERENEELKRRTVAPVAEPAKPAEDPVAEQLAPYAALLNQKIESGELEREDANKMWAAEYREAKREHEIKELRGLITQQNAMIAGTQMKSVYREAMLDPTVGTEGGEDTAFVATPGGALEKEVNRILQDRGVDITNPQMFAGATPEQVRQFVDEFKYIAMRNLKRAGATRPNPNGQTRTLPASGGTKPVVVDIRPKSFEEVTKKLTEKLGP